MHVSDHHLAAAQTLIHLRVLITQDRRLRTQQCLPRDEMLTDMSDTVACDRKLRVLT